MRNGGDRTLFSIITVCKNAGAVLDATLASLQEQTFQNFQLIVVDGKSTDNTHDIIRGYGSLVDTFISEEDDGIFYAMNKGLGHVVGDYIYFLNAGDLFHDRRVLKSIADELDDHPFDILYGDTLVVDSISGSKILRKPTVVDKISLWSRTINHQALFARRSVFDRIGAFDTSFKMKADHDWIIRCYNHACTFRYVPLIIAEYDNGGFSVKNWRRFIKQDRKLLHEKNYSRRGLVIMKILRKLRFKPRNGYIRKLLDTLV